MDQYVTGAIIKRLREEKHLTQAELAERLLVSDKAVSKWETGKGYPDITLIEPIAKALGISVQELLLGSSITNRNRSFNMLRVKLYVCPLCGNVLMSTGEAVVNCCGLMLNPLEPEEPDDEHTLTVEPVEDEYFVSLKHPMTKTHNISFIAAVSDEGAALTKLYPEGEAAARFKRGRTCCLYYYCNHHGLFRVRIPIKRD